MALLTIDVLLSLAALTSVALLIRRTRRYRLPPGPKGLPIIGNALQIPKVLEWVQYRDWSLECGSDIIHLDMAGTPLIVLNSARAVNDLMEKRSILYSHKEYHPMVQDHLGWDKNFAFIGYDDYWREHRKLFHLYFNQTVVTKYHPALLKVTKRMLVQLYENANGFMEHFRLMTGSMILHVTYGLDIKSADDPLILTAEKALQSLAKYGCPGSCLADYIPFLRYLPAWMPGGSFKREASYWQPFVDEMFKRPYHDVKDALADGRATSSVLATIITKGEDNKGSIPEDRIVRDVVGTAFVGGTDTTVSSLGTFMLAMTKYPDVLRRAQKEIDEVVGQDRLPEFDDRPSLPYVTAIVKEVARWHPVLPLSIPRQLKEDDEYMGYDFPAGSVVVANSWAVVHQEERFPHPEEFDPTRYLTPDGKLNKKAPDPEEVVFGSGRRVCPGRHLAMDTVWINAAYIISTLDISKPVDELGNVIEPSGEYTSGLFSYPLPFKVVVKPRSEHALQMIQALEFDE